MLFRVGETCSKKVDSMFLQAVLERGVPAKIRLQVG
jgi:hypothetical protein